MRKTSLLLRIEETLQASVKAEQNDEELAQAIIEATADWFEKLVLTVGVQPSTIPSLLRWQAHAHQYLDDFPD